MRAIMLGSADSIADTDTKGLRIWHGKQYANCPFVMAEKEGCVLKGAETRFM